jgi:hypothetical protein
MSLFATKSRAHVQSKYSVNRRTFFNKCSSRSQKTQHAIWIIMWDSHDPAVDSHIFAENSHMSAADSHIFAVDSHISAVDFHRFGRGFLHDIQDNIQDEHEAKEIMKPSYLKRPQTTPVVHRVATRPQSASSRQQGGGAHYFSPMRSPRRTQNPNSPLK